MTKHIRKVNVTDDIWRRFLLKAEMVGLVGAGCQNRFIEMLSLRDWGFIAEDLKYKAKNVPKILKGKKKK